MAQSIVNMCGIACAHESVCGCMTMEGHSQVLISTHCINFLLVLLSEINIIIMIIIISGISVCKTLLS